MYEHTNGVCAQRITVIIYTIYIQCASYLTYRMRCSVVCDAIVALPFLQNSYQNSERTTKINRHQKQHSLCKRSSHLFCFDALSQSIDLWRIFSELFVVRRLTFQVFHSYFV